MSIEHQRKMSASQQLQKAFLLLFILFCSVWCATNSKIDCSSYTNGADYIDGETEGKDITYGDCSFENTLCNYTQACTNGTAQNWTVLDGRAVCRGSGGDYNSFSVLLSPLLKITRNTSLVFNYTRNSPATLSVFVATRTEITEVFPEQKDDAMSPKPLVYIKPSMVKIGFRARRADPCCNVTLSHVKLQAAPSTDPPAHVTDSGTPSTRDQSTISSATPAGGPEPQNQEDSSNAGVIAGVLVAVVVLVAAGVVGIFIWRRHKQRQNRNSGQETVKGELNIYQSADLGVMTTAATMPSPNKSLTKSAVNPVNAGNKATPGVMGSNNQYDVPRNGLPAGRRVVNDEQSRPPDLTSPFAGDCEEDGYHILEDDSAMGASQATGVYSLARNEDTTTLIANDPDGHYDKTDSSGGMSPWQGEIANDYNHIVSADRTKEKGRHFEDNKKHTPTYSLATGRQDNGFNENTSREDEDGYSVLCGGNTQPRGVNGQQATEAYDHIGGDFHGDYDRIRQGDSKDVIGSDYDHVI